MTIQARYNRWRRDPEGAIYSDGRPTIFTEEEWERFKKLIEEEALAEPVGSEEDQRSRARRRRVGKTQSNRRRKTENLRPRLWHLSLDVRGLKKDYDRFNVDLPHILEGAALAYGLTNLKVRRKKK